MVSLTRIINKILALQMSRSCTESAGFWKQERRMPTNAARSILRVPAPWFYMNPEQEIELVLRVLSTKPTGEEIVHLEQEEANRHKDEQEPEEKTVAVPVPVGGNISNVTAQSVSFKKFRTHETTSSAPQRNGRLERPP